MNLCAVSVLCVNSFNDISKTEIQLFFSLSNSVYFIPQILSCTDIFQSITERACVYVFSNDNVNSYLIWLLWCWLAGEVLGKDLAFRFCSVAQPLTSGSCTILESNWQYCKQIIICLSQTGFRAADQYLEPQYHDFHDQCLLKNCMQKHFVSKKKIKDGGRVMRVERDEAKLIKERVGPVTKK